jgi:hypothetical protein
MHQDASDLHNYAEELFCLICHDPAKLCKIKTYAGLDTNQPWNLVPLCPYHISHPTRFSLIPFKAWAIKNGWFYHNGIRRKNSTDWTSQ